jgi:predicted transglutaminase-like cysteine proteinase
MGFAAVISRLTETGLAFVVALGVLAWCPAANASEQADVESPSSMKEPAPEKSEAKKKNRLFGTLEFKGRIKKLPKWSRVLDRMHAWKGYFRDSSLADLPSKAGWIKLKADTRGMSRMERLKAVNKFFNRWPYRLDPANYGTKDYWATPPEFLKRSGDCEDYAIAKFYALKELGFSGDEMRIVALKDLIRNIGHAVLAVYLEDDIYVLDNQTVMVLPHSRYKHYLPYYSVNEKFRWMHVPTSGGDLLKRRLKQ